MSYKFGTTSRKNLEECHPKLQALFNEVIKIVDCSVIEGFRPEREQNKAYHAGKSKLKFPASKHNQKPSLAVDVVPWPVDWEDTDRFYFLAGIVKATAFQMGYKIRSGCDWDGDNTFTDQTFHDLPHFEIVEED